MSFLSPPKAGNAIPQLSSIEQAEVFFLRNTVLLRLLRALFGRSLYFSCSTGGSLSLLGFVEPFISLKSFF